MFGDLGRDILGRLGCLIGQRLYLARHDGEALARLAGRAASIVALSAGSLVCDAIELISSTTAADTLDRRWRDRRLCRSRVSDFHRLSGDL